MIDMKGFIVWLISSLGTIYSYAQCTPTYTETLSINPVCSLQEMGPYGASNGIVKISLDPLEAFYVYRFSTVGLTTGDTHLFLYDASGNLIVENDNNGLNDVDTYESDQSTITYTPTARVMGAYLILAKSGCNALDFSTKLEYNVTNISDFPYLIENLEDNVCVGNTVALTVASVGNPRNWFSSDTSVATIDNSGTVTFLNPGLVTISVATGPFSCVSTKKCRSYFV